MSDRYFMVHGNGPTNHKHASVIDAEREADRLARANPGQRFYVLEAIGYAERNDLRHVRFHESVDDRPWGGVPAMPF